MGAMARPDGCAWCEQPAPGSRASTASERTVNVAPARLFDHKHMRLELTIADMNVPRARGVETLTISALGESRSTIELDARGMKIEGVTVDGREAAFTHDGRVLRITPSAAMAAGVDATVVTTYELNDPKLGMVWTPASAAWGSRPAQIHTQGQPETNSYWFPCHDYPNDRLTTELIVTAPAGYTVSSNGRLVSREKKVEAVDNDRGGADLKGFERWHWVQDKEHVNYLVTLVVGKFDVVDVAPKDEKEWKLELPVYVPQGRGGDVAGSYGRTAEMIRVFEGVTGRAYPWDRYAQLVVWNFGSGGMENTSATSMYDTAIVPKDALADFDLQGLISHELAHQWFGDLITCDSWDHVWLNEGWATYMTSLWLERRASTAGEAPASTGVDAYYSYILANFDSVIDNDKPNAPEAVGLASNEYQHPWETFRRAANPYSKGSSVLHMLREKMGDRAFFGAVRAYVAERQFTTVKTDDFRGSCEQASGQDLGAFFQQWTQRPGVPKVDVTASWDANRRVLTLGAKQTQKMDAANPAFVIDVPVWLKMPGSETWRTMALAMPSEEAGVEVTLEREPEMVVANATLEVLADVRVTQAVKRVVRQLTDGPTLVSRVYAARALGHETGDAGVQALRRVAMDRREGVRLRTECVKALAKRKLIGELQAMASATIDRWEVREELAGAIANLANEKSVRANAVPFKDAEKKVAEWARKDKSLKVRAAAIRGLGTLKSEANIEIVREAMFTDSHEDVLRQAGIDAMVSYDTADALKSVSRLTAAGNLTRTRAAAAIAAGKLGEHDREAAYTLLAGLLNDRESRVMRGAGEGLVELGDARGLEAIERWREAKGTDEFTYLATGWMRELRKKVEGSAKR